MPIDNGDILNRASDTPNSSNQNGRTFGGRDYTEQYLKSIDKNMEKISDSLDDLQDMFKGQNSRNARSIFDDKRRSSGSKKNSGTFGGFGSSSKKKGGSLTDALLDGVLEGLGYKDSDWTGWTTGIVDRITKELNISSEQLMKGIGSGAVDAFSNGLDDLTKSKNPIISALAGGAGKFSKWMLGGINDFNKKVFESADSMTLSQAKNKEFEDRQKEIDNEYKEYEKRIDAGDLDDNQLSELFEKLDARQSKLNKDKDEYQKYYKESGGIDDFLTTDVDSVMGKFKNDATKTIFNGMKDVAKTGDLKGAATKAIPELAKSAGTAAKGLMSAAKAAGPQAAVMIGLELAVGKVTKRFGQTMEALDNLGKTLDEVGDRYNESERQKLKDQNKRYQQDVEAMIKQPFTILEDAAQKVYDAWDATVQIINGTQGYDKAGLQDLMTAYASRLKSEGLDSVIGNTDVTTFLSDILQKGLSGKVAEEFAYQASVLNAAIPTADFSGYAQSYATIAAQRMREGASEAEALAYATEQLKLFASSTLRASREVSGGFTTSLSDVSSLFDSVTSIATLTDTSDVSNLSSALLTVQAIAGRVSSNTGSTVVEKLLDAAKSGNEDQLTALRSLANVGASNTAFLRALVNNPNTVLATLFSNLSSKIDTQSDNYMEVAYGLSDVFGISAEALVSVDWDALIAALKNNNTSLEALNQNMTNLSSGETTTDANAMRYKQINEYMIDQGLAYVLDNETARTIQEHMWDQERAEMMMEATYAVELEGAALETLQSLESLLSSVFNILNPKSWLEGIVNTAQTAAEDMALKSDLQNVLLAGKVGKGNAEAFHNLTTYDVDSLKNGGNNNTKSLIELYGGTSAFNSVHSVFGEVHDFITDPLGGAGYAWSRVGGLLSGAASPSGAYGVGTPTSSYTWGSKSSVTKGSSDFSIAQASMDVQETVNDKVAGKVSEFLDTFEDAVTNGMSFDQWMDTASDYGINDMDSALESIGMTKNELEGSYIENTGKVVSYQNYERDIKEEQFWDEGMLFWTTTFPEDFDAWTIQFQDTYMNWVEIYTETMAEWSMHFDERMNQWQEMWSTNFLEQSQLTHDNQEAFMASYNAYFVKDYLKEWKRYYLDNYYYKQNIGWTDRMEKVIATEKSQTGESILALAKAITEGNADLRDPTVQTNTILAQILIVLEAIMQQNNTVSGLNNALATSLAGMATGAASGQSTTLSGGISIGGVNIGGSITV